MKIKKVLALLTTAALVLSMTACGKDDDSSKTKAPEGTTGTTAATEAEKLELSDDPVTIRFTWWGGDSRHEATLAAVDAFMEEYPNITVETQYGSWSGWEDKMAVGFSSGKSADVNQVNWNWISSYSEDGSVFLDLNNVSDFLDLTQFSEDALNKCVVANELQAIPIAMTGRIFYWNKTSFEKAGIEIPTSLNNLLAAGQTFKEKLGDDYYPLVLGEYDRMILMVYYLESVYGKDWVVDNKLNYTKDEIGNGLEFINSLEDNHVTPTIKQITGDGAESLDKNPKWMEGKYAGIFEWSSSATKFEKALNEDQEFVVGDYFADMGEYQGGYAKVSQTFAISETTKHPAEAALLINYLLNDEEGAKIMGSQRGVPLSQSGLKACVSASLLDEKVVEATSKVLSWTKFSIDPKFESAELKSSDGIYYDVMSGLSYEDYDISKAADTLINGINDVLSD